MATDLRILHASRRFHDKNDPILPNAVGVFPLFESDTPKETS